MRGESARYVLEVKYKVASERVVRAQVKQGRTKRCGSSEAFAWNCWKREKELKESVEMMVRGQFNAI